MIKWRAGRRDGMFSLSDDVVMTLMKENNFSFMFSHAFLCNYFINFLDFKWILGIMKDYIYFRLICLNTIFFLLAFTVFLFLY